MIVVPTFSSNCILAEANADYGVTIPVSTLVTDWKTAAGASILNALDKSSAIGWSSGHWDSLKAGFNGIISAFKNIGNNEKLIPADTSTSNKSLLASAADILACAKGQVQTSGTLGSFMAYNGMKPIAYCFFYGQAEMDLTNFGAPLHQKKTLSTLSGFCLCQNAKVTYSGKYPVDAEQVAVETALNSGFFLE